jgi:hypothetical protein
MWHGCEIVETSKRLLPRLGPLPSVTRLRQVFDQHDERGQTGVRWREGPAVNHEHRIGSPDDEPARSARKRELVW